MDYWTANSLYIASESRYMEASESRFTCMNERPSLYPHTLCLHQCCHAWDKRWSHANLQQRITLSCMGQANHALHMGPANIVALLHCCLALFKASVAAPLLHCCLALFKAGVAALFEASVAAMLKAGVAAIFSKRVSLQCYMRPLIA